MNQGENSPWGEGKGCDFLLNTCSNEEYPEFNNNKQGIDGGCSFFGHARTYNTVHDFVETNCYIRMEYNENDCRNGDVEVYYGGIRSA